MIAAWGDEETDEEEEQPEEEVANLCLMANTDETATNEVSSKTLRVLSKNKLIDLLLETLDEFKELSISKEQCDKALTIYKDHISYLNNIRSEVQEKFFELLDRNIMLTNSFERAKNENILLKVELAQYRLFCSNLESASSIYINMGIFNTDLESLNMELVTIKEQKEMLEKELALTNARKLAKPLETPKWILNAQTKRTEGLGFNYKKKSSKRNKYVDLPSIKVCSFCGNGEHVSETCSKRNKQVTKNMNYVWMKKADTVVEQEPEIARVPETNN